MQQVPGCIVWAPALPVQAGTYQERLLERSIQHRRAEGVVIVQRPTPARFTGPTMRGVCVGGV